MHRLDQRVSGAMVVARSADAATWLAACFASKRDALAAQEEAGGEAAAGAPARSKRRRLPGRAASRAAADQHSDGSVRGFYVRRTYWVGGWVWPPCSQPACSNNEPQTIRGAMGACRLMLCAGPPATPATACVSAGPPATHLLAPVSWPSPSAGLPAKPACTHLLGSFVPCAGAGAGRAAPWQHRPPAQHDHIQRPGTRGNHRLQASFPAAARVPVACRFLIPAAARSSPCCVLPPAAAATAGVLPCLLGCHACCLPLTSHDTFSCPGRRNP